MSGCLTDQVPILIAPVSHWKASSFFFNVGTTLFIFSTILSGMRTDPGCLLFAGISTSVPTARNVAAHSDTRMSTKSLSLCLPRFASSWLVAIRRSEVRTVNSTGTFTSRKLLGVAVLAALSLFLQFQTNSYYLSDESQNIFFVVVPIW